MYKINVENFKVVVTNQEGVKKEVDYGVKDSMIEVIFNPALKLNASKLLKQNDLAKKIMQAKEYLLIEDEEYSRIKDAFEKVEGLGKNDVELVNRIINAEKVEVEVK